MVALRKPIWTPQSYLAFEETSEVRHEFFRGEVYSMAGATLKHNVIKDTNARHLGTQLEKKSCLVVTSDMRVKIASLQSYVYPDVVVVCGTPEIEQDHGENLLNPTLVVEVASPSTADFDRGGKFAAYQQLKSLQDYIVVQQDEKRVEHFHRHANEWILQIHTAEDAVVHFPTLECQLALVDIYANAD